MIDSEVVFRRNPRIRFRIVGGEAVVVQQETAEVLVLNASGARILELLDGKLTFDRLLEQWAVDVDASKRDLDRDARRFLQELEDAQLIERADIDQ